MRDRNSFVEVQERYLICCSNISKFFVGIGETGESETVQKQKAAQKHWKCRRRSQGDQEQFTCIFIYHMRLHMFLNQKMISGWASKFLFFAF